MATKKRDDSGNAGQPLNREERRRQRFGAHRPETDETGGWPEAQPNPAFGGDETSPANAGPGTGGETEGNQRVKRHSGTHATNAQKQ